MRGQGGGRRLRHSEFPSLQYAPGSGEAEQRVYHYEKMIEIF